MDRLGSLDPQQLLRLMLASGACIVILAAFMVAYIVLARRARRATSGAARSPGGELKPHPLLAAAPARLQPPVGQIRTQPVRSGRQVHVQVEPQPASAAAFSLVEEIDRIFQAKLAVSTLAAIDAQLQAGPDGGVRVRVSSEYYDAPDQVPDQQLRDLIKQSIAEW
jgi:hypothetical protein